MSNKTIEQLQADVRDHLADCWDELPIIDRAEYISGVKDWPELHHDAFNCNYYIIGTWEATEWLGDCVFEAIEVIREWEKENIGEVNTDFSDPERVVNMYAYIEGEQAVYELAERYESEVA
tara:strand:- start:227 stop:589 length:363 start_codon:yes stop_codon:yes gene_type:complete